MPIIHKIVHTKVPLPSSSAYSMDIDSVILDHLNHTYAGRCMWECKVLEVLNIIKRGDVICDQHRQDGLFTVTVQIRIRGVVARPGDVMFGFEVVKIQADGTLILKSDDAAAFMRKSPATQTIHEKHVIPIIVRAAEYDIMKPQISINAAPFAPAPPAPPRVYSIMRGEDDHDAHIYTELKDAAKELLAQINRVGEYPAKLRSFYEQLLGMRAPRQSKTISLDELLNVAPGTQLVIVMPVSFVAAAPAVELYDGPLNDLLGSDEVKALGDSPEGACVHVPFETAIRELITLHSRYLDTLSGLCEAYPDPSANQKMWDVYNSAKQKT